MENRNLLIEGAKAFGVSLDEEAVKAFDLYLTELLKWNQKMNLTAIRSEKGIVIKHFLDSLSVCPYLPKATLILDIGSGAGFPGIPLKIVDSTLSITLIDSVLKKVDFQRHMIRKLGLTGVKAIHGRAQEKGIIREFENRFDRVISRAFSDLQTILHLAHPFLKNGGLALAMKGELKKEEVQSSLKGMASYRLQETIDFTLPYTSIKRTILLFEKQ
ncbi:MAG TPA: 16S rRNA (guanine(527)-N(7))-methyltransferase RsmG [Thermodesulfobacteriota bacterium]|nr:16S rRNA (guanine(527)-N(7))-methyltransferase RsmG [Thermodesulfobacteriota bacterium]